MVREGVQVSQSSAAILVYPFTHKDIDDALSAIYDSKAPGIDGFNGLYLRRLGICL